MTPTSFMSPKEGELLNLAAVERFEDIEPTLTAEGAVQRIKILLASGKELIYRGDEAARVRSALLFWHQQYVAMMNAVQQAQNPSGIVMPGKNGVM